VTPTTDHGNYGQMERCKKGNLQSFQIVIIKMKNHGQEGRH